MARDLIHDLFIPLIYPIIAAIIITYLTAFIYHTGPFAPPGAEISYKVENYYNMPDGSFMQPICIWNSGSKDVTNLDMLYYFESYTSGNILDKDFSIINVVHNTSPQFRINKADETNNSREFIYPSLKRGVHFREQFYINKPYQITVISSTPDLDIKQNTALCDPCTC